MSLPHLKTPSGKTIQDFTIPEEFLKDTQLVQLIMESESMNDDERQYWFNLFDVMSPEQVQKLRDILTRERDKLAEIENKYAKKNIDLAQAQRIANEKAAQRTREQDAIEAREKAYEAKEKEAEAAALAELENL